MMEARVWVGFSLMAAVCLTAVLIGDRPVRRVALLIAGCWTVAVMAELLLGHDAEVIIAADLICGFGFLAVAALESAKWIWLLVTIQSVMFLMHALFYQENQPSSALYIDANNALTSVSLAIVLAATLIGWRRRAGNSLRPTTLATTGAPTKEATCR